jgi:carbamoyl-phosphate synthase large subunit
MTTITGALAALNGIKALRQKRVGVRPLQKYMTNIEASG